MLRNRSRAVTTKQTLMADQTSVLSPTKNPSSSSSSCSSPISSFLNSPRFFNGFLTKNLFSDTETTTNVMSPTSILVNPFGYDKILSKFQNPIAKQDTKVIGLALIDTITIDEKKSDDKIGKFSNKPINRASLYGSKLKVQIPVINPTSSLISPNNDDDVSPKSPADFGIKTTKNSQNSSTTTTTTPTPVRDNHLTRQLSLKEMELSEDYTRVITHGPNPKTTHIFDDCIVERCLGDDSKNYDDECSSKKMDCGFVEINVSTESFLSFCHTCRDMLGQGKDIYIYRGEKAFCSHECRCQEMFFEEMKNPELDE